MSIVGAKHLIPHFQHRRNKASRDPKVMHRYDKRARMLSKLGYVNYAEYLASQEWKTIRSRVLAAGPVCVMCNRPSVVVHHVRYWDTVLLGLQDTCLAPLCHGCHESIEVQDGQKTRMGTANNDLFAAVELTPHGLVWLNAYRKGLKRKGQQARA